ncbi:oligosaccharide flippase family protein [Thermodesulfovibrionales bacterium]|nr:oligosaccharide flippase family protein [Thermodesulfovibrionales bacterium]
MLPALSVSVTKAKNGSEVIVKAIQCVVMQSSPLKKNIAANFAGSIWQTLIGLLFIPLYIKFIGIESWGLIGIFITLQAMFGLLDMGLSATLNREMARLSVLPGREQEMRNLVRTLEVIYLGIAIFIGITVVSLSPFIAHHWIQAGQLSPETIEQALLLMGFAIALQVPAGFYSGGLMGLQRQVLLNVIIVSMSTLRGAGAVLILWLISPTIQAFFVWQIVISTINLFLLALFLWRRLPFGEKKAVFQKQLLKGIWRFTAGMSGIAILAVILTQLDKIILSRMLSLEMFGYYMLASIVAMSLGRLFTPIFHSIYPRFTQLTSLDDQEGLKQLYHKSCQFMAVLILPVAIVIAFFSYEILLIWTQNPTTAENTHLLVSILIFGTALNGLMYFPYALQLASGWTRLSFLKNVIAVVLTVPLIIYMTTHYGAIGAAIVWLVLNMGYVFFEIPIMHRRLLRKEKWRWYWQDVCVPLVACILTAGLGRALVSEPMSQFMMVLYLLIISVSTLGVAAITTPATRKLLFEQLLKIKLACRN